MIDLRRRFHRYPELGFQEFKTQQTILSYLEKTRIPAEPIALTGVKAVLSGSDPGRTLLLRSDMDALPVTEETGLEFQSVHKGIMHACGHDGHMAMLLVASRLLSQMRHLFAGNIVFAFQPNEEDAGAGRMVEEGILENPRVDAAFGCHLWSRADAGVIDISDGPVMAASHYFTLEIRGSGGHAGFAHVSVDPVLAASHVVQAVQAIQTRQIDALHPVVIMFTRIQGGVNATTIPETVVLEGSIRFLNDRDQAVLGRFEKVVADICRAHNAGWTLDFKTGNHVLVNDPDMAATARIAASGTVESPGSLTSAIRTMAGEDFSEFSMRVPSCFAFIGSRSDDKKTGYPHHHPGFDIDENVLVKGASLYTRVALEFLKKPV